MSVRRSYASGQFYPENESVLRQNVLQFLEGADISKFSDALAEAEGEIKAVIVPHAGYQYSGQTAAFAYKALKSLDKEREWKVLLIGPSHNVPFIGAAVSVYTEWQTPMGLASVRDIREEISGSERIYDVPNAGEQEHSLEVQVPFLQMCLNNFTLYPLLLGDVRPDFLANDLSDFCKRDDVIIVVSSDLSHSMDYEKAKEADFATSEVICNLDIDRMIEIGDACCRSGILALMFLAEKFGWKCKMLDYTNSGDITGEKGRVTGYGGYSIVNC